MYLCLTALASSYAICGDGDVEAGEECDDVNLVDDDGCSSACLIEDGWACFGSPSQCVGICGDEFIVGNEQCEDTNTESGDGCYCGITEDGFLCSTTALVCNDINECASGNGPCATGATCSNTFGSYFCTCTDGYAAVDDGCEDEDECSIGSCSPGACQNTDGSYQCECGTGYQWNTTIYCDDVDECGPGFLSCSRYANCTNTVGNYSCQCNDGFVGNGTQCDNVCGDGIVVEVEECDDSNSESGDGCSDCVFETGYSCIGQPSVCTDIDDCASSPCYAECFDIKAPLTGFICAPCPHLTYGDGIECDDATVPISMQTLPITDNEYPCAIYTSCTCGSNTILAEGGFYFQLQEGMDRNAVDTALAQLQESGIKYYDNVLIVLNEGSIADDSTVSITLVTNLYKTKLEYEYVDTIFDGVHVFNTKSFSLTEESDSLSIEQIKYLRANHLSIMLGTTHDQCSVELAICSDSIC